MPRPPDVSEENWRTPFPMNVYFRNEEEFNAFLKLHAVNLEGEFHKVVKTVLAKRLQGLVMGAFRKHFTELK
jgi:hypothetical protein